MNKLDTLFTQRRQNILNMYCTAGFPEQESTETVMLALQEHGADIIELGIPYSDPIADGPVIQQSNMQALANGISIKKIFTQLESFQHKLQVPVILMGYLNPVMQYGLENFCRDAAAAGVCGVILPDLPLYEYEHFYQEIFSRYKLNFIFLVSPQTSDERIKKADELSGGFLYAVSSSATTGQQTDFLAQETYFKKLKELKLRNPVLIGFGIKDRETFELANKYAAGAIIGSAYIKAIENADDIVQRTGEFIRSIRS